MFEVTGFFLLRLVFNAILNSRLHADILSSVVLIVVAFLSKNKLIILPALGIVLDAS